MKNKEQKQKYIYTTTSLNRIPFWMPTSKISKNKNIIWKNKYGEIKIESSTCINQTHRNVVDGILAIYRKKRINDDQSIDFLFSLSELKNFIRISHSRYINQKIEEMMRAIIITKIYQINPNAFIINREQMIWRFEEFSVNVEWAIDVAATQKIRRLNSDKTIYLYFIKFSPLFVKLFLRDTILFSFDRKTFRNNIKAILDLQDNKIQAFVRFCLTLKEGTRWNTEFVLQQIAILDKERKHSSAYRKAKSVMLAKLRDKKKELQDFGIYFESDFKNFSIKERNKIYKFYFASPKETLH